MSALKLNLGCGRNILDGWVNVDSAPLPGVDIVANLDCCAHQPLPFSDSTVDEFLLSHVIEHIRQPLPLMQELHRIARPGARMVIRVPHGASDDAHEDPTHVRLHFPGSFAYFSQLAYWRADYGYRGDWEMRKLTLFVDPAEHAGMPQEEILERMRRMRNVVREMVAELEAIKPTRVPQAGYSPAYQTVIVLDA